MEEKEAQPTWLEELLWNLDVICYGLVIGSIN